MENISIRATRFIAKNITSFLAKFCKRSQGNIAILTAFSLVPLTFGLGFGVDYTLQQSRQVQIQGIADAASLDAVNSFHMGRRVSEARGAAIKFWNAQTASLTGVTNLQYTIDVFEYDNLGTTTRNATINWSANSQTYFLGLFGIPTLPISGTSVATNTRQPNINFYMILDTSPSMGIAATTNDINTMVANTPHQAGGCAFACHESAPTPNDVAGNPNGEDNYTLARSLGVTLRIDLVNFAVQSMLNTAAQMQVANKVTYGFSISTIDFQLGNLYQTNDINANLPAALSTVGTLQQLIVSHNDCVELDDCSVSYTGGRDTDSSLDLALSTLNNLNSSDYNTVNTPGFNMFWPGSGTSDPSDSPQEILFIVSDGLVDEDYNGHRTIVPINSLVDNCSAIKNENIRIAFLYLTYYPLPTNAFYNRHVAPLQNSAAGDQIAAGAQNCASPGLFTQVSVDGDVTAALNDLFKKAVATARLTQ